MSVCWKCDGLGYIVGYGSSVSGSTYSNVRYACHVCAQSREEQEEEMEK